MRRANPIVRIRRGGAAAGFTIIELLISMCVLAVILGIVYAGFQSVADTSDLARARAERLRLKQFTERHFRNALSALYIDSARMQPELAFVGYTDEGAFGPADSLQFCSSEPMGGARGLPGMRKTVSYGVEESGDEGADALLWGGDQETEHMSLIVQETPLVLAEPGDMEDGQDERPTANDFYSAFLGEDVDMASARTIPIRSMDILYYDGDAQEWLEEWDSSLDGWMPWAVRILINFARTEDELDADQAMGIDPVEDADLDMTVVLPIAAGSLDPFIDLNHQREPQSIDSLENMTGDVKRDRQKKTNDASK